MSEQPVYATFADGHEAMSVGDAIASSSRTGGWVGSSPPRQPRPGLPDRAAAGHAADGGRRLGRRQRVRQPRDRGLAARQRLRRYAGTSHIDVANLSQAEASDIVEIEAKGLKISGLGFYPNRSSRLGRDPAIAHIKKVIEACRLMGVPYMNTFMGGDSKKDLDDNWQEALRVWPDIVRHAKDNGVKLTIENCPMIFSRDNGRGNNIAWSPYIWRRILEQWGGTIGLNYDPSHLVWLMIDQGRFIREFGPHILHFQAKDVQIDRDGLYERGSMSSGIGWQIRACPAWATPTGARSSATCTASATTATASSSTRTAASRAPTSWSSAASARPQHPAAVHPQGLLRTPMTTPGATPDRPLRPADLPRRRQDDRPLAAAARAGRPVHRRQLPAGGRVRRRVGHRPTGRCATPSNGGGTT